MRVDGPFGEVLTAVFCLPVPLIGINVLAAVYLVFLG
jgi:hypothetical protein